MTLLDELKRMKRKGRQVVSIDFVLKALRLTESDLKEKVEQLDDLDSQWV